MSLQPFVGESESQPTQKLLQGPSDFLCQPPPLAQLPILEAEKLMLLGVAASETLAPTRRHPSERKPQEAGRSFEQSAWCVPGLHLLSAGSKSWAEGG
ncbi:unnamed protein product [Rangifer tarandus platyrhynchus]|uniref:Uncharacterized protein n=1 Tax=Rangifer tarandus platyrhynchus TaxID=3082113 RepID=A0AC59ZQW5_RANTA